jgi:hypothetical protein
MVGRVGSDFSVNTGYPNFIQFFVWSFNMKINRIQIGKGGGGSTSTKAEIPDEFKPYLFGNSNVPGILNDASALYGAGGFGGVDTPGATTQQAWGTGKQLAGNLQTQFLPQLQSLMAGLSTPGSASGPQLDAALKAAASPLQDQYARTTVPSIQDAAIQAGAVGGSRQGIAEGLAKSELDKNITNINATTRYQALTDDLNRTLQGQSIATQFAPILMSLMSQPTNILSAIGSQEDAFQSLLNNAGKTNIQDYAALIRQFIPGTSQTTSSKQKGSPIGGALAGAGTGAMIGSAIPGFGTALGAGVGALGGLFS